MTALVKRRRKSRIVFEQFSDFQKLGLFNPDINDKFSNAPINDVKRKGWLSITAAVNSVGGNSRSAEKVRGKWWHLQSNRKKKLGDP